MYKSGHVSIDLESSKTMTKEQIYEAVKGNLDEDFEVFYLGLTKANGTYESTCEFGKSVKVNKSTGTNKGIGK